MKTTENDRASPTDQKRLAWPSLAKRIAIWGLFLLLVYLTRDFFFLAFMTFMISYLALAVIDWVMRRLSPNAHRPGIRRLVTLGIFILAPLLMLGIGVLIAPRLMAEGQRFAGWVSQVNPESEVAGILEKYVGPAEFRRQYGGSTDVRYQKALEDFRKSGERHVTAYIDFPKLEAWIEGGFSRQFADSESSRIRSHLLTEGTSSQDFERWFLAEKFPALEAEAKKALAEKGHPGASVDPLAREALKAKPEQLLQQVRRDPVVLANLRDEWLKDSVAHALATAKNAPAYQSQFHEYYDRQRQKAPQTTPYTFEQYIDLQAVRPRGARPFGETWEKMSPSAETDAGIAADFEAAKKHELFQTWWSTNSSAKFVRHEIDSHLSGDSGGRVETMLTSLLNVPLDLMTALLLSFFMCIDFPRLQRAMRRLRETWLRDVYDEMAPAFSNLASLIGRSMQAQGLIAVCNATIIFIALEFLGVEHAVLLGGVVFVLCLVPTLGMIIAWALLVIVALVQPGGGIVLAMKVSAAVVLVVALETFVFSPRILGRLMELHPVLIIAILPIAHYFFGVWGLILAVPVTVYLIHDVILGRDLSEPADPSPAGAVQPGSN